MKRFLVIMAISCVALTSCGSKNSHDNVINDKSTEVSYSKNSPWVKKLHQLKQGKNIKFRIIQLGDSHTAGDYFTGELRSQLQQTLGNGGIGLVSPTSVSGQRNAQIKYTNGHWQTLTSRKQRVDFPLGGVVSQSTDQSRVFLSPIVSAQGLQNIQFYAKPQTQNSTLLVQDGRGNSELLKANSHNWQLFSTKSTLPLSYQAQSGEWSVGQIRIENNRAGITLSAMGINGAQLSHTSRWHPNWINELKQADADLVILAFGTNESTNEQLNIDQTEQEWRSIIQKIQKTLPNVGILIIGAPESLKNTNDLCGKRLVMLDQVQEMQKRLAQKLNVAYWSWQNAMGGHCSMKPWIAKGLARSDGLHFTAKGYQQSARYLANSLIKIAK